MFLCALVAALATACSQRVTPEEEYAQQERERPLVSLDGSSPAAARAPAPAAGSAASPATEEDAAQTIRGTIEAPAGAAGGVLFVFVRAAGATGGPPLAVQRIPSPTFPRAFAIGPADAMIAGGPFPDRVTVEARLDGDGNAMTAEPGDLSARSEAAPGDSGLVLALSAAGA
jgi:hypothetical protein